MSSAFIDVNEIKHLTIGMFQMLEEKRISRVQVDDPYYWTVFPEVPQPAEAPAPVLGDVFDDLDDVRADAARPSDELVVWHAFNHLAGLIKLIARADLKGDLIEGALS